MKKALLVVATLVVLISSTQCNQVGDWVSTHEITEGWFMEIYVKGYGVYGGEVRSYFLTDSAEFKKQLGTCDEKEWVETRKISDTLFVYKLTRRNWRDGDTIRTSMINLKNLKRK